MRLFTLLLLVILSNTFSLTHILPDYICKDTTFGDTVFINGSTWIDSSAQLTFLPGTVLLADTSGGIRCTSGTISSIGTADNRITITALDSSKGWQGISIGASFRGDTSIFDYTDISYVSGSGLFIVDGCNLYIKNSAIYNNGKDGIFLAKSNLWLENSRIYENMNSSGIWAACSEDTACSLSIIDSKICNNATSSYGGGISSSNLNIYIKNSSIDSNSANQGAGISAYNGTLIVEGSTIDYNIAGQEGGGIFLTNDIIAQFSKSSISNNRADSIGGGIRSFLIPLNISECTMNNNYANSGGAIYSTCANIQINRTTFKNDSAYTGSALYLLNDTLNITNSLVSNCIDSTAAIFYDNLGLQVPAYITNCTIADNSFFGVSTDTTTPLQINNTIIWGHTNGDYLEGTGPGITFNNYIESEQTNPPEFLADYSISGFSPCVNAGNADTTELGIGEFDLSGNARIQGSSVDIGAFEVSETKSSPNIFAQKKDNITIVNSPKGLSLTGLKKGTFEFKLLSINGQTLFQKYFTTNSSTHLINLNNELCSGSYIAVIGNKDSGNIIKSFVVK